jgi:hypothetical protein
MGHDKAFLNGIPKELFYFGFIHLLDQFFIEMPTCSTPVKKENWKRENSNKVGTQFKPSKCQDYCINITNSMGAC